MQNLFKSSYTISFLTPQMRLLSASQPASLTTGNNLLPKPVGIESPFFLRVKVTINKNT